MFTDVNNILYVLHLKLMLALPNYYFLYRELCVCVDRPGKKLHSAPLSNHDLTIDQHNCDYDFFFCQNRAEPSLTQTKITGVKPPRDHDGPEPWCKEKRRPHTEPGSVSVLVTMSGCFRLLDQFEVINSAKNPK